MSVMNVETVWGNEDLTPGSIDENARYAFTHGQCHALALAIHEETGWQLVMAGRGIDPIDGDGIPSHWVVKVPTGEYLDILGIHTEQDIIARWGHAVEVGTDVIDGLVADRSYLEPDMTAGREFAATLLAEYAQEVKR